METEEGRRLVPGREEGLVFCDASQDRQRRRRFRRSPGRPVFLALCRDPRVYVESKEFHLRPGGMSTRTDADDS